MTARHLGNGIWTRSLPFERIVAMAGELDVPVLVLATLTYLPPPGTTRAERPTMTNADIDEWMSVLRANLAYCYRIRDEASPPTLLHATPPTPVEQTDRRGRTPRSPETRARMAAAKRAWWTPERRAAWSEEMKRRNAARAKDTATE